MDTPTEWIAEVWRYAAEAPALTVPQRRLFAAAFDGAWHRFRGATDPNMVAAVEAANELLPPELRLGFVDIYTGEWTGEPREIQPLKLSPV